MTSLTTQTANNIITALMPMIEARSLTSQHLGATMSKYLDGSDATGAWNWREAYDLMQAATRNVVAAAVNVMRQGGASDLQVMLMIEDITSCLPTETRRSERQMMLQQFSTPLPCVWLALCAAQITMSDHILEPSTGTGAFSTMASHVFGAGLSVNEIDPLRNLILEIIGVGGVTSHNGEFIDDLLAPEVKPTVVVMNPPFASSSTRGSDPSIAIRHVISAAKRLEDGGRLVAIVPPSVHPSRQDALWARLTGHVTPVMRLKLPRTTFAKLGTTIETHILIADKGAVSQKTHPEFVCSSLLEALGLIQTELPKREVIKPKTTPVPVTRSPVRKAGLLRKPGLLRAAKPEAVVETTKLALNVLADPRVNAPISDIYARYAPQRLSIDGSVAHPTPLVESIAMGSVVPPLPTDVPIKLPNSIVTSGALSEAQLETLVMAETSFQKDLPGRFVKDDEGRFSRNDDCDGGIAMRQGYFLGDGTGCGKGRQVAGIILAGWLSGQKRAVWVSKSSTLIEDARRDWKDLGGAPTDIHALSKWKPDDDIMITSGILFMTYATLRSISKTGRKRLDQVTDWLGADFEGVIAFDEAHAMQNASGGNSGRGSSAPSQQGLAGLQLQDAVPRARILYVSATGATTVSNLAYATRLGIWGQGDEYAFASRERFISEMEAGGVSAMEVVARDLKSLGLYTARALSFDGVEYDIMEHALSADQIEIYDTYADAFKIIHQNLHAALEATGVTASNGSAEQGAASKKSSVMSVFESTKQRFFSHLLQGLKAPSIIAAIQDDISKGWAPVVQIVSTGEALLKRRIESLAEGDDLIEAALTPKEYVVGYLESAFPIHQQQLIEQPDGSVIATPLLDEAGERVVSREAQALRDAAMEEILCVAPVASALEQIIWSLGTEAVAEVTGRSQRAVKSKEGRLSIEKRSASSNSSETNAFMDGDKNVLIFSDAGGTGRSYQAASSAKNQKRRRHYLLEPGWRADNAIQGLGRTHRAVQVSAPFFRVCTTNVHGEKRFTSTIARRLDTLGALTKGQREAASQGMFREEDNLESPIARGSLRAFFADMVNGYTTSIDLETFCEWSGLSLTTKEGTILDELPPIQRFLNRALAMPIAMQNAIFTEFMGKIEVATDRARQAGTLDVGLETLRGDRIVADTPETLRTCPTTKAQTSLVPLKIDKTLAYQSAKSAMAIHNDLIPMQNAASGKVALIARRPRQVYDDNVLALIRMVVRPNSVQYINEDAFGKSSWHPCDIKLFTTTWDGEVADLPTKETIQLYLVTGLILPVWQDIPGKSARIYRVQPEEGPALLGRALTPDQVVVLRSKFCALKVETPEEILVAVRQAGMIVNIGKGLDIMNRTVAGQARLEISGASSETIRWLKTLGCFTEIHQFQLRVFVPNTLDDVPARIIQQIQGGGRDVAAAPFDTQASTFPSVHTSEVAA